MNAALLVALGGAVGSLARFKLSEFILFSYPALKFPLGTFIVNLLGCLVIGALAGLAERPGFLSGEARFFLFAGVLGGFTTFSAFSLETFNLLRRGEVFVAGSYVGLSAVLGVLGVYVGFVVAGYVSK